MSLFVCVGVVRSCEFVVCVGVVRSCEFVWVWSGREFVWVWSGRVSLCGCGQVV